MKLNPGDSLYYKPHSALAVLIERFTDDQGNYRWSYALRSPRSHNNPRIVVGIREDCEAKLLGAVESGDLVYYESR